MQKKYIIIGLIALVAFFYGNTYGAGSLGYLMGSLTIMVISLYLFAAVWKEVSASMKDTKSIKQKINLSRGLHKVFVLLCLLWLGYMVYKVVKEPSFLIATEPTLFITIATLVPAAFYGIIRLFLMLLLRPYRGFKTTKEGA